MLINWAEPVSSSSVDRRAAQNKLDAEVGWFLDPIFLGDYPASLRATTDKKILPAFTGEEKRLLNGSLDFVTVNCFTGFWVKAATNPNGWSESRRGPDGKLIGAPSGVSWIYVVPDTQEKMLKYVSQRYGKPQIVISSSGVMVPGEASQKLPAALRDTFRLQYYYSYLNGICAAVKGGVKVVGWYAWSFLDSFEFTEGFKTKFGIVHVDHGSGTLRRTPKDSATWLSQHFFSKSA
eukprot:jgi/Chrzof1/1884/Cz10g24250.t1